LVFIMTLTVCFCKAQINETFDLYFQPPQFPNGNMAFNKYLKRNLKYPTQSKSAGIEGIVIVQFTVDSSGVIIDSLINVLKGVTKEINLEAKRLIVNSPKWLPGRKVENGPLAALKISYPIHFKIEE
ncbi:MAG: energy transducer TonB, partial [Reichenbachiella sp.]